MCSTTSPAEADETDVLSAACTDVALTVIPAGRRVRESFTLTEPPRSLPPTITLSSLQWMTLIERWNGEEIRDSTIGRLRLVNCADSDSSSGGVGLADNTITFQGIELSVMTLLKSVQIEDSYSSLQFLLRATCKKMQNCWRAEFHLLGFPIDTRWPPTAEGKRIYEIAVSYGELMELQLG